MAITFTCQCGQRLSARDEAQGKATKCPKCGAKVVVPHAVSPAPQASPPPPSSPAPQSACPGCGAVMPSGAVICVHCGYNAKLGRRMEAPAAKGTRPPSMPSPVAQAIEAEMPAGPRSRSDRRGWIVLDTGLAICYSALIVGAIGFGIIAVLIVVGVADPSALAGVLGGPGTGRFVATILPWCALGCLASWVAMVTGWFVCCGVPEKTRTRQLIQGSVACVGITVGFFVLQQVVTLVMVPSIPSPGDVFASPSGPPFDARRMPTADDFQKMREAAEKTQEALKSVASINKILSWLAAVAFIASSAVFSLFLGGVGQYFRQPALRLWSYGLAGVQGAIAVCVTLLFFVVSSATSPGVVKSLVILSTVLQLATYCGLIYMVNQARNVVPADG